MNEGSKIKKYTRIEAQLTGLSEKCDNPISRMATIVALLHYKFDYFFWTGFYIANNGILQVGPYQGPLACQQLALGKGVCWEGYSTQKTVIVPDVEKFPGHIACNSKSKSEIVVPVFNKSGVVYAVLDVDSDKLNAFDETDAKGLENILRLLQI